MDEPYAVFEAKTSATYDGWGEDGSDEIPVHYRCQVLWQMDVLGVTTGVSSPACSLHSRTFRVYEITLDADAEHDLKLMREEAEMFWSRIAAAGRTGGRLASRHHRRAQDPATPAWSSGTSPSARSSPVLPRRPAPVQGRRAAQGPDDQPDAAGHRHRPPRPRPGRPARRHPQRLPGPPHQHRKQLRAEYPQAAAACTDTKDVTKLLPAKGES